MEKKVFSILICLMVCLSYMPVAAMAENGSAELLLEPVVKTTSKACNSGNTLLQDGSSQEPVEFINHENRSGNAVPELCREYKSLKDETSKRDIIYIDGWYVIDENMTIEDTLLVNNTAYLILMNGVTLECKKGICVEDNSRLVIYGQAEDKEKEPGTLIATGHMGSAGIGSRPENNSTGEGTVSSKGTGTIIIHGGNINAYGGAETIYGGAGIGGGSGKDGDLVIVYGGNVTARGVLYGAGIGGGKKGNGGVVVIYGGTVDARSVEARGFGAGIGGGGTKRGDTDGKGCDLFIYGGTVTAQSLYKCIGSGGQNDHNGSIYVDNNIILKDKFGKQIEKKEGYEWIEMFWRNEYVFFSTSKITEGMELDKSNAYYKDALDWAVENGITSETAVTFDPLSRVTRAQAVTFLWRTAGSPVVNYSMNMTDVKPDSYYSEAVRWALSKGITKGTGDKTFKPEKICTRAEMVTLLSRFAGADETEINCGFDDVKPDDYFASSVKWARDNDITKGTTETTFSPKKPCLRAEAVTFLYRWMKK